MLAKEITKVCALLSIIPLASCYTSRSEPNDHKAIKKIESKLDIIESLKEFTLNGSYELLCSDRSAMHFLGDPVEFYEGTSSDGSIINIWSQKTANNLYSQGRITCQERSNMRHYSLQIVLETDNVCISIDDMTDIFGNPNYVEEFGPTVNLRRNELELNKYTTLYSAIYESKSEFTKFVFNYSNCAALITTQKR